MTTNIDEKTYKKWDSFVNDLIISLISAQDRYNLFLLDDLDPKSYYDLLFTHVAILANNFIEKCELYTEPYPRLFKYLRFKLKEPLIHRLPHDRIRWFVDYTYRYHICKSEERQALINELTDRRNITCEEIELIYKEYYAK